MNIEERLDRIERRQETMITSVQATNLMLSERMTGLQDPPSSELPDSLRMLVMAIEAMADRINTMPSEVAQALQ